MTRGDWHPGPQHPHLAKGAVHVWRISIDPGLPQGPYWSVLSPAEQARALRFHSSAHQAAYVLAHGAMRTILAAYEGLDPVELRFETAAVGKPALVPGGSGGRLEFNLSHSGNIALLAVARDRAVGVDVVQWDPAMARTDVAERYFSPAEREALRSLAGAPGRVEGFFAAWSRKEAYLKATGHGVSRGLDHFDVSLSPGEPAALLADRRDADAPLRWTMVALAAGAGYSAALVAAAPAGEIALFDAPAPGTA